ncbi:MAG: hypothetical protein V7691_08130 [Galbibacter orientalis]|uniref:DUF6892 domain-containing protein n=1 Tax=Galbibacter orientalis TaxID=453852 RepID=UPI003002E494
MITLHLSSKGFQINSRMVEFPVSLDVLKDHLTKNYRTLKKKNNTIFTWDDLGILAYSKSGELIESIIIELQLETYDFSPKKAFSGIFHYNNQEIISYYKSHKNQHIKLFKNDDSGALVSNGISAWFDMNEDTVSAIEISAYKPYVRWEGIPEDKYKIKRLDEEVITFEDFGFKLSVIEELMYTKELLKPQFDIHEFAKWYRGREIDIDEEGYGPIAEVEQYFKDLPIPKRLAEEVTEIYQDGGNEIYMNLAPFSGGAVEYWDIEHSTDAKQFPNLKKATLCYAKDTIYDEFIEMGIDTEWL